MKKYWLVLLLMFSLKIYSQTNPPKINTTFSISTDLYALLGESVSDLFIDPEIEGRLIACNWPSDYGVKISTDNGENWTPARINTLLFQYLSCTSLSFNPSNSDIGYLAAGIDLFKTTNRGESWDSTNMFTNFFDIRYVVYHPLDTKIIFVSNFYSLYNEVLLYKSNDGGNNWSVSDSTKYDKLVFSSINPNVIYGIVLYSLIKKTTDGGKNWETINNNLVFSSENVRRLEISEYNPDILYCGQMQFWNNEGDDLWLLATTTNGGDSWTRIDSTLREIDSTGSVNGILLDKNIEGRFFVSYTGGLYLTEDNGKHFQNVYSGGAGRIWSDNKNPPNIYFNSDRGLLRILDTLTVGMKNIENDLPSNFNLEQNYPNPFNPSTVINYSIPKSGFVTVKVFDVLGKVVSVLVDEEKAVGNYSVKFSANNLPSGVYFYRIKAVPSSGSGQVFMETKKLILLK